MAAHLSEQAVDFRQVDYTEPCVIIMGTEKLGISEEVAEIADEHIVVPMLGLGQSLNVSVATAVILYEAQRQRWEKGCYERGTTIDPETYRTTLFEWMQPKLTRYCKQKGIPYPNIDEDGDVVDHELTQAAREAKSVEEKPDETDHTNLGS